MLGYAPRDQENVMSFYMSIVHPDDINKIRDQIKRIVETGDTITDIELRLRHKDGKFR